MYLYFKVPPFYLGCRNQKGRFNNVVTRKKKKEPKDYRDESFRRRIIQKTEEPIVEGLRGRSKIRALTEEFVESKKTGSATADAKM